jgi:hypothetical protein
VTTDAEIDASLLSARKLDREPVAQSVLHSPDRNLVIVGLSNGRRLVLQVEDLPGLSTATPRRNCGITNYWAAAPGSVALTWTSVSMSRL